MAKRRLEVVYAGDASGAIKGAQQTEKSLTAVEKAQGKADKAFSTGSKNLIGFGGQLKNLALGIGVGGGGLVGGLVLAANKAQDLGLSVGKLQRLTGGTAEEMSVFAFAASQVGIDVDSLGRGIKIMSKNMYESVDAFAELGVKTHNADGSLRDNFEVMSDIADKFEDMEDGAVKVAFAQEIFGKSGADLIPLLNGGREAMEKWRDEAEDYGLVMGQDTVDQAKKLKAAQRDLEAQFLGIEIAVGQKVMPVLTNMANWLKDHKQDFINFWADFQRGIDVVADSIKNLWHDFGSGPPALTEKDSVLGQFLDQQKTNGPLSGIAQTINPEGQDPAAQFEAGAGIVSANVFELGRQIGAGWDVVEEFFGDLASSTRDAVFAIGESIGKITEFFEGFIGFMGGIGMGMRAGLENVVGTVLNFKDNVISWVGTVLEYTGGAIFKLMDLAEGFIGFMGGIGMGMVEGAKNAVGFVIGIFEGMLQGIQNIIGFIGDAFFGLLDKVTGVFSSIWDFATGIWGSIQDTIASGISFLGDLFGDMWGFIADPLKEAINKIADIWNNSIGALSFTFPEWFPVLGGKKIDVPDIPTFHDGGVFRTSAPSGEGLAMLRNGERVLTPGQQMGGGVTIIVQGSVVTERELTEMVRGHMIDAARYVPTGTYLPGIGA